MTQLTHMPMGPPMFLVLVVVLCTPFLVIVVNSGCAISATTREPCRKATSARWMRRVCEGIGTRGLSSAAAALTSRFLR